MEIDKLVLYAWMGEDEFGSGEIGLKQALCPAGYIPMVSTSYDKIVKYQNQFEEQARKYGKRISLVRFIATEVMRETEPK